LDDETRKRIQERIDTRFKRIIKIGEMFYGEEHPHLQETPEQIRAHFGRGETITPEFVTLEEALNKLPFEFAMPTWIPDGFVRSPHVDITAPTQTTSRFPFFFSIHCDWSHEDGRWFHLFIRQQQKSRYNIKSPNPVEPDSVFEVQVNGKPAAFITHHRSIRPATGETSIWHHPQLIWWIDDLSYKLTASENFAKEELIRIAESVQPQSN
jgi:hypothetical protein